MGFFSEKKRYFNPQLALTCSLIAVSTFNYGFDNQAFATTQAMTPFAQQFGSYDDETGQPYLPASWLSLFSSLNYIGFAAGVLVGSWISARWGRRMCMFVMSIYALGTATVCITSRSKDQIMAARILNYVYVGMELAVVPAYQSEIVPAPVRGLIVGTYQLSLGVGGVVINCICLGTSTLPDNRAWRIPLGLFYVVPTIVASAIWFVPESPRWLLQQGRTDEARVNLFKYRAGVFTDEEVEFEIHQTQVQLDAESEQGRYIDIFNRSQLKRTMMVVGLNFFQEITGQQFSSQFGAIFVKQLNTVNPFIMTIIMGLISVSVNCVALLFNDQVGRRPPLLLSAAVMAIGMLTMGGLGTADVLTRNIKIAIVSMLGVSTAGFALGLAPLCYVVSTELPALRLRDATLRTGFFVNVATK